MPVVDRTSTPRLAMSPTSETIIRVRPARAGHANGHVGRQTAIDEHLLIAGDRGEDDGNGRARAHRLREVAAVEENGRPRPDVRGDGDERDRKAGEVTRGGEVRAEEYAVEERVDLPLARGGALQPHVVPSCSTTNAGVKVTIGVPRSPLLTNVIDGERRKSSSSGSWRTTESICRPDMPLAYIAPMTAPMLVPTTSVGRTPRLSSTSSTPMCASPCAPPPERTTAERIAARQ